MKITKGQANGTIILAAQRMGYDVSCNFSELAAVLYEGNTIEAIHMGTVDSEATRLNNLIAKDGRVDEANKIALNMLKELEKEVA